MKKQLAFLLLIFLTSTCKNGEVKEASDPCSCAKGINCTAIYISVALTIKNQSGQPVSLDDYYTTKISTGEKINLKSTEFDSLRSVVGKYPILADGQMKLTEKCGTDFEFTGIKGGKEIIKKTYNIGHDCCHVTILSGDPDIIMQD